MASPDQKHDLNGSPARHDPAGEEAALTPPDPEGDDDGTSLLLLAGAVCAVPALLALGSWWAGDGTASLKSLATAAGSSAVMAFLYARWERHPVSGLLPGLLAGAGAYGLTLLFTMNKLQTSLQWLTLAALGGTTPGLGVYVLQVRRAFLRNSESPMSPWLYWAGVTGAALVAAYIVLAAMTLLGRQPVAPGD